MQDKLTSAEAEAFFERDEEEAEGLTEEEFAEALGMVLEESGADEVFGDRLAVSSTRSFRDVGMLTMNAGVVARTSDGPEWQLTVVRSKGPGG